MIIQPLHTGVDKWMTEIFITVHKMSVLRFPFLLCRYQGLQSPHPEFPVCHEEAGVL